MTTKKISIPKLLHYTKDHLWLRQVGQYDYFLGITDFAQKELGPIASVHLPSSDNAFRKKTSIGGIFASDKDFTIIPPFSGRIAAINIDLNSYAFRINREPYVSWLLRITANKAFSASEFLSSEEYSELIR